MTGRLSPSPDLLFVNLKIGLLFLHCIHPKSLKTVYENNFSLIIKFVNFYSLDLLDHLGILNSPLCVNSTNIMAVALSPFCHLHCSDSHREKYLQSTPISVCNETQKAEHLKRIVCLLRNFGAFHQLSRVALMMFLELVNLKK